MPSGLNDSAVAAYYHLMIDSATILGADRREAEIQMLQVLNFETQLANVSINQRQEKEKKLSFELYSILFCLLIITK